MPSAQLILEGYRIENWKGNKQDGYIYGASLMSYEGGYGGKAQMVMADVQVLGLAGIITPKMADYLKETEVETILYKAGEGIQYREPVEIETMGTRKESKGIG